MVVQRSLTICASLDFLYFFKPKICFVTLYNSRSVIHTINKVSTPLYQTIYLWIPQFQEARIACCFDSIRPFEARPASIPSAYSPHHRYALLVRCSSFIPSICPNSLKPFNELYDQSLLSAVSPITSQFLILSILVTPHILTAPSMCQTFSLTQQVCTPYVNVRKEVTAWLMSP